MTDRDTLTARAKRLACDCSSPDFHQTGRAECMISQLLEAAALASQSEANSLTTRANEWLKAAPDATVDALIADRHVAYELVEDLAEAAALAVAPQPLCACGTVMVCPDIGCDLHKAVSPQPPDPPHVREDYREVWLSGWRAGVASSPVSPQPQDTTDDDKR